MSLVRLLIVLTGASALALTACGSEFASVCSKQKDCTLGNDDDKQAAYDSCIAASEQAEQIANDYSCGSAFSTYAQCVENSASCVSGEFMTGNCGSQNTAVSACETAASAEHGISGSGSNSTGTGGSECSSCMNACAAAKESNCATLCASFCS